MSSRLTIRVQKLFLVALVAKVASSFAGWYFQAPWTLGFAVPIALMILYIGVGLRRSVSDVSDEKFADSCYYLGFIFTITSIVFCLFDLPNIGTQIQDIAVRFGAAMVSTVLGLGVRVYLVSFRADLEDAMRNAESGVVEASEQLREQLRMTFERLRDFDSQIGDAAQASVHRVALHVEALSRDHTSRMVEFVDGIRTAYQESFQRTFSIVEAAHESLAESTSSTASRLSDTFALMENGVRGYSESIKDRLSKTQFPDDYFARGLATPLENLAASSATVAEEIGAAATDVKASTELLAGALKSLRSRAVNSEKALDRVLALATQQEDLFAASQQQLAVVEDMAKLLGGIDASLATAAKGLDSQNKLSNLLFERIDGSASGEERARAHIGDSWDKVVASLASHATSAHVLTEQLASRAAADQEALGMLSTMTTLLKELARTTNQTSALAREGVLAPRLVTQSAPPVAPAASLAAGTVLPPAPVMPPIEPVARPQFGVQGSQSAALSAVFDREIFYPDAGTRPPATTGPAAS